MDSAELPDVVDCRQTRKNSLGRVVAVYYGGTIKIPLESPRCATSGLSFTSFFTLFRTTNTFFNVVSILLGDEVRAAIASVVSYRSTGRIHPIAVVNAKIVIGMAQPSVPLQHDERRGFNGIKGRWIGIAEAKEYARQPRCESGVEWWKMLELDGAPIQFRQYDTMGPRDKPFWLFENNDIYLGEWKFSTEKQRYLEHGRGIMYNNHPAARARGLVCCSELRDGWLNGRGKSTWIPTCKIWKDNYLPGSVIRKTKETERGKYRYPFNFDGYYRKDHKHGVAVVTLKDGTN